MADADDTTVTFDAPFFRSAVEKVRVQLNEAFRSELRAEANGLQVSANADVPKLSGELAASSFTDVGLTQRGNPAATVGYDAPYAAAVHEGFHGGKQTVTPRQFWLQSAANRFAPGFAQRMAKVANGVVR